MKNSLHIWNFGSIVTVSSEWLHHLSTVDLRSHDLSVVNKFFLPFFRKFHLFTCFYGVKTIRSLVQGIYNNHTYLNAILNIT